MSTLTKLILDNGNFMIDTSNFQFVNIITDRELSFNNTISADNFFININGASIPVLPDNTGHINFYTKSNTINTVLTYTNTDYDIIGSYFLSEVKNFNYTIINDTISIQYIALYDQVYKFNIHFRASSTDTQTIGANIYIQVNSTTLPNSNQSFNTGNGLEYSGSLSGLVNLLPNDVITIKIKADNTGTILVSDLGLVLTST